MRIDKMYLLKMIAASGLLLLCLFNNKALAAEETNKCSACHVANKSGEMTSEHPFIGEPDSALFLKIEELLSEIDKGTFLSSLHHRNQVTCGDCHADGYEIGTEVQTSTCLECHGSYEELAEITRNNEVEESNPHGSHLGEIDCSVCHHAHEPSITYCIQCHAEIIEAIPGN